MPDVNFRPIAILQTLHAHEVRYVLIGALAATLHGSPIATNDADICPARDDANLQNLAAALNSLDARLRTTTEPEGVEFVCDASTLKAADIWTLITRYGFLDISFTPSGTRGFDDLNRDAVDVEITGVTVLCASLLDIIRSKEAANRLKDQAVLPLLREMLDRYGEHP
ncbi:MAG: hypothetical protein ACRDJV_04085 [Actinomycetota bacterium]